MRKATFYRQPWNEAKTDCLWHSAYSLMHKNEINVNEYHYCQIQISILRVPTTNYLLKSVITV